MAELMVTRAPPVAAALLVKLQSVTELVDCAVTARAPPTPPSSMAVLLWKEQERKTTDDNREGPVLGMNPAAEIAPPLPNTVREPQAQSTNDDFLMSADAPRIEIAPPLSKLEDRKMSESKIVSDAAFSTRKLPPSWLASQSDRLELTIRSAVPGPDTCSGAESAR